MAMEQPIDDLEDARALLAELKARKAVLGDKLTQARQSSGEPPKELLAELQKVSGDIKQQQKWLKQQASPPQPEKWQPEPVEVPNAIGAAPDVIGLQVEVYSSDHQTPVHDYLTAHPAASIWHQPQVLEFIRQTFGHPCRYFLATDVTGQVVGVLPVVQLKSQLFGNFLVSLPYFNYGGVLADNPGVASALVAAADLWREDTGAKHLELRHSQDHRFGLPQRTEKVTFWLPLPRRETSLWDSFDPKLRAQIRRGERAVTELNIGGVELLDDFYRVFSTNMRDLGTPVYSRDFFTNLLATLDGKSWLVVARIDGKAVGCAFLTGYKDRMEIPWASTLRDYNHTSVNMIMYWKVLVFAVQQGYGIFDFGRCSEQAGTYRFKAQWGAQPFNLHWDYVLPEAAELPGLNPNNPKFRLLIAIWKRLPLKLAELIGPRVVKSLP